MQLRILLGWAACLFVQLAVMLDEQNTIEAVVGRVDEPHALAMAIYLTTGAIEALLLRLYFIDRRVHFAADASHHISEYEHATKDLISPYPEDHARAVDVIQSDPPHAEAIVRGGYGSALVFFLAAAALVVAAGVLAVNAILLPLLLP